MRKSKRTTFLAVVFLLAAGYSLFSAQADPFYTKLFQEGKRLFFENKFQEAAKNFRIAEFGLYEEKEVLKELYLYYALTQLKLERPNEASEILKRFETELGIKDIGTLHIPPEIDIEVKAMRAALGETGAGSWERIFAFESLILKSLQMPDENRIDDLESSVKRLKAMKMPDPRLLYLEGVLSFKQKRYKDCIKELNRAAETSLAPRLMDKLHYYLVLSNYARGEHKQMLESYQKIADQAIKARLAQIVEKVNNSGGEKKETKK